MPNQRADGQKLLTVPASEEFIHEVDANIEQAGYRNRSQFIRDAIVEKLERAGVHISKNIALAPSRLGTSPAPPQNGQSSSAKAVRDASKKAAGILRRRHKPGAE